MNVDNINPKVEQHKHARLSPLIVAALLSASAGDSLALEYQWGDLGIRLDNQISLGATFRASDVDPRFIGKSNLQPGLCLRDSGGDQDPATTAGDSCNSTADPRPNQEFVRQPGSYTVNSDNGDLNYEKGDVVAATAKIISDVSLNWGGKWGALLRGNYFYDPVNRGFRDFHPDLTFQPGYTRRPKEVEKLVGKGGMILDGYVHTSFDLPGERSVSLRVGDQVVNWGESTFLLLNSINTINPPSAPVLRSPGFDLKELLIPAGMVFASTTLAENIGLEAFYQYEFEPAVPDPVGSFFSTNDAVGEGGRYIMLGFGKVPEDPNQRYNPATNGDDLPGTFSSSSRTILRTDDRLPKDSGQYGMKLGWFLPNLNNGTDLGFYYLNYHQRLPVFSALAASGTCIPESATTPAEALVGCGLGGNIGQLGLQNEPLPVDTPRYFLEYPENIHLYGTSFNTTIGNWAWSGEVAYRPNQPLQIHPVDVISAAEQPAFPANDIPICAGVGSECLPGTPIVAMIPGRRSAAPDFVSTRYRNRPLTSADAGSYVRGYEQLKVANFGTTFLNTFSSNNPLKADQIIFIFEVGGTKVFDMPDLDELQFGAAGADTHASGGADGTPGIGPNELGPGCRSLDSDTEAEGPTASSACRQNPTAEEESSFADDFSWGLRTVAVVRYQNAFHGVNLEPLVGLFHDVKGIAPGPGGNFIEGRSTVLLGVRWDYISKWSGEFRYTMETGAGFDNPFLDRDTFSLVGRYEF